TRRVEHLEHDKVAQNLEITKLKTRVKKLERTNKVKTLKLKRLRKVRTSQMIESSDDTIMEDVSNQRRMIDELDKDEGAELINEKEETEEVKDITGDERVEERHAEIYQIDMDHAAKVLSVKEDETEVQEVVEVVTTAKLITKVVAAISETVSAANVVQAVVPATTVTPAPVKVVVPSTRRRRGVVIRIQRRNHLQRLLLKPSPKTREKNTVGFRLDYFKGMSYGDIRPIFEAKFNANMEFLLKSKEQIEEEESKAIASINKTPAQKAARRRRLIEEAEDVEEINQHLEIMPDKDDDVYTEATPLAMKVPVVDYQIVHFNNKPHYKIIRADDTHQLYHLEIVPDEDDDVYTEATPLARKVPVVDYQIVHFNNKPHYKIIRADETHQLYVSFITLLKNIDREDLESLWSLVKERFSTSKPNNFFDNYLLIIIRAMFGRTDGQDQIWKSQRSVHGQAMVKSWKMLQLCGVHIITFTTTQIILLIERRYPLSRFTLDQMLNTVRLQVEEQSEMSLELIRFTRQ
nr:hypothetical protein [Tanacetum cinerariifolium]